MDYPFVRNSSPSWKACAKIESLINAKNRQNSDFESRFQGNYSTYKQTFDVFRKSLIRSCYHDDLIKKYSKVLPEIRSKNLEHRKFSFTPVEKRSRDSSLGQLQPWIFKKLANRILVTWSKIICIEFADIFHKKSCNRGCFHPTDAINR